MTVRLLGIHYSYYVRIARIVLAEKGVAYRLEELNPFAEAGRAALAPYHPFARVPVLLHDDRAIYECAAVVRYVDEAFSGPSLQPSAAADRARMQQTISVIDNYGYWPIVRQIFSHRVARPVLGEATDEAVAEEGVRHAPAVLAALDGLAGRDEPFSLADAYLAALIDYLLMAPEGAALLAAAPRLRARWQELRDRPSVRETRPSLWSAC